MKISDDKVRLLGGLHHQPHELLGMHPVADKLVVRALLRGAVTCEVVDCADESVRYPLQKIHDDGLFEGEIKGRDAVFGYRLRVRLPNGEIRQFYDPYCYLPTLSEDDLFLFNEGNDHQLHCKMGSHLRKLGDVPGVSFTVWAPSARRVSVVGDFNGWDGRYHPMRSLGSSGVWELFIPGLERGVGYKYEILGADGGLRLKSDPFGHLYEPSPNNASIVWPVNGYEWGDKEWMARRAHADWRRQPISVYEVHMGSWRRVVEDNGRPFTYREMATALAAYVKDMGFTHVEFMPLAEHPYDGSWGYQVTGFFAPTHRFGTPQDFMYLVDTLHRSGIGVIMDWVPAHFPRDRFALAEFDGTHLYEHSDPRQGQHQDWGTLIFNYGRHEVRGFLTASALAWFDWFHIDGMRVDAVASMLYLDYSRREGEWVANRHGGRENLEAIEFIRSVNDLVHRYHPGALMIAEESTAFPGVTRAVADGGLGFDLKWNMGWMHDTLQYFENDPLFRKWHHHKLTFAMLYQYSEQFVLVFSHDEVVHGKGSLLLKMAAGTIADKARSLRALYAWMWCWPGKKTLFMGCEFGQSAEWRYDQSLDWHLLQYIDHRGVQQLVRDLNRLYRNEPALAVADLDAKGFRWVNAGDAESSVLSFLRLAPDDDDVILVVGNFTPVARNYRLGVPAAGFWREVLNSNASEYGGEGSGNAGGVKSEAVPCDGRSESISVYLPGMTTLVFRLAPAP